MHTWARVVEGARWETPMDVKATFGSADPLKSGRFVFDIGGNKFRIVAFLKYASGKRKGAVFVKFVGTHAQYDKIDANEV